MLKGRSSKDEERRNKEMWVNDVMEKLGVRRAVALKVYAKLKRERGI